MNAFIADVYKTIKKNNLLIGLGIFAFVFLVYIFTVSPCITWGGGDSPKFAIWAKSFSLEYGPLGHPLFIVLGNLLSRLSFLGDNLALLMNLLAALFGALTAMCAFFLVFELTCNKWAALWAGLSIAFSHTFWLHSVITEVYTLHAFLMTAVMFCFIKWHKTAKRDWFYLGSFLFGLAFSNHVLIYFLAPALIYLIYQNRHQVRGVLIAGGFIWMIVGALLIISIFMVDIMKDFSFGKFVYELRRMLVLNGPGTHFKIPLNKVLVFPLYVVYQFPGLGIAFALWGMVFFRRVSEVYWGFLFMASLCYLAVPFIHDVRDYYQFAISFYVCVGLWVGVGAHTALIRKKHFSYINRIMLTFIVVAAPVFLYMFAPLVVKTHRIDLVRARTLPFRDNDSYFLNPSKAEDISAEKFGIEAMALAEKDSVIVGDFTPIMVLRYFKEVEGMRPDIKLVMADYTVDRQINAIKEYVEKRPVYVTALEGKDYIPGTFYLKKNQLEGYKIVRAGPLYKIEKK